MDTRGHHHHELAHEANDLRDPVCGMNVKPDTPHRLTHEGDEVLFCSAHCKAKFAAKPETFAKAKRAG